jgi:hypothetical protein
MTAGHGMPTSVPTTHMSQKVNGIIDVVLGGILVKLGLYA